MLDQAVVKTRFFPHRYPLVRAIVDPASDAVESLADKVGEEILKQIISGKLPGGSPLNSKQLAKDLGVSRTPLAKILTTLTADGILIQPKKQPAIVSPAAAGWLKQTRELRQILEPEATSRASGQVDAAVLEDLFALSREAMPTTKFDWTDAAKYFDAGIHLTIAEFCGNLPMKVSIRKCWVYKRLAYEFSPTSQSKLKPEYEQHVAILEAVAAGDSERARSLMEDHLKSASPLEYANRIG